MKTLNIIDYKNRSGLNIHRKGNLVAFDYGKEIQFSFDWDEITLSARGIVFDEITGKCVALPFPKFFNYEELIDNGPKLPVRYRPNLKGEFMSLEKADGSCGIAFFHDGAWIIKTRGSFESEQAVWAQDFLDSNIKTDKMNPDWTYLFEIIYPENRIVVDYGKLRTLCLIGVIVTSTGEELWIDDLIKVADTINCPVVKAFKFNTLEEMYAARENWTVNEEGIVVTYKNGYKFKLKGEMYCKVHRTVSNMTPLNFWRAIDYETTMRLPQEFLQLLPEEFRDTVDALCKVTEDLHNDMYNRACELANSVPDFDTSPEGLKSRYMWIKDNIPKDDVSDVLGIISAKSKSNGNDWKVRDAIHRRLRPTSNNFNGIDLDPRLQRILENS